MYFYVYLISMIFSIGCLDSVSSACYLLYTFLLIRRINYSQLDLKKCVDSEQTPPPPHYHQKHSPSRTEGGAGV
jgi:hypothetical protein